MAWQKLFNGYKFDTERVAKRLVLDYYKFKPPKRRLKFYLSKIKILFTPPSLDAT